VGRALSKKPEERYPSWSGFRACLARIRRVRNEEHGGRSGAGIAGIAAPDTIHPTNETPIGRETHAADEHGLAAPRRAESPIGVSALPPEPKPAGEKAAEPSIKYEPPPPPPERPETTGDGVLVPALVVGLGGLGREVLQQFRKALRKRGQSETWPHIRLLNVDTDPEGYEHSTQVPDSVLSPEEIMVTAFQRPSIT